jgi:CheY-like chemotaxis protein
MPTILVCGDPVVGRALVLLLGGLCYDAKLVTAASLRGQQSLEGVQLLLLTPMSKESTQRLEVLSVLSANTREGTEVPTLELVTASAENQEEEADGTKHVMPWPCRTEELEQRIRSILLARTVEKS